MSQQKLAAALGLTFQQIQKYERGTNRIGASRLFELSEILDVPTSFFFDGLNVPKAAAAAPAGLSDVPQRSYEADQFSKREILELVRAYDRIQDPDVRDRVFAMVKAVAAFTNSEDSID
jgi:transcriptional regulator with XRE-family HTH domain